jgi:hypothetical protein
VTDRLQPRRGIRRCRKLAPELALIAEEEPEDAIADLETDAIDAGLVVEAFPQVGPPAEEHRESERHAPLIEPLCARLQVERTLRGDRQVEVDGQVLVGAPVVEHPTVVVDHRGVDAARPAPHPVLADERHRLPAERVEVRVVLDGEGNIRSGRCDAAETQVLARMQQNVLGECPDPVDVGGPSAQSGGEHPAG